MKYRVTKNILVDGVKHEQGELLKSTTCPGTIKAMLNAGQAVPVDEEAEAKAMQQASARHAEPVRFDEQVAAEVKAALELQSSEFQKVYEDTVAEHAKQLQAAEQRHADAIAALETKHKAELAKATEAAAPKTEEGAAAAPAKKAGK